MRLVGVVSAFWHFPVPVNYVTSRDIIHGEMPLRLTAHIFKTPEPNCTTVNISTSFSIVAAKYSCIIRIFPRPNIRISFFERISFCSAPDMIDRIRLQAARMCLRSSEVSRV